MNKVARMTKRDRAGRWITSPMASRATVISAGRDCRKPSAPLFSQLAPCLQSREAAKHIFSATNSVGLHLRPHKMRAAIHGRPRRFCWDVRRPRASSVERIRGAGPAASAQRVSPAVAVDKPFETEGEAVQQQKSPGAESEPAVPGCQVRQGLGHLLCLWSCGGVLASRSASV